MYVAVSEYLMLSFVLFLGTNRSSETPAAAHLYMLLFLLFCMEPDFCPPQTSAEGGRHSQAWLRMCGSWCERIGWKETRVRAEVSDFSPLDSCLCTRQCASVGGCVRARTLDRWLTQTLSECCVTLTPLSMWLTLCVCYSLTGESLGYIDMTFGSASLSRVIFLTAVSTLTPLCVLFTDFS